MTSKQAEDKLKKSVEELAKTTDDFIQFLWLSNFFEDKKEPKLVSVDLSKLP
jgi:hypothetical protein